jgi:2'-5' RNA ligase
VRLFTAIDIGPDAAAGAGALAADLRARAQRAAPRARITWIPPERMHLTIRFIGEADEALGQAIVTALEPPIAVAPFELRLAGCGAFPPHGAPRVLWVGVVSGEDELQAIEHDLSRRLEGVGVPPEGRPYRPHLTLARVREPAGLKSRALLGVCADAPVGAARVEAITLYESRQSSGGPTYVPLRRTDLWKSS